MDLLKNMVNQFFPGTINKEVTLEKVTLPAPKELKTNILQTIEIGIKEYAQQVKGDPDVTRTYLYNEIKKAVEKTVKTEKENIMERRGKGEKFEHDFLNVNVSECSRKSFNEEGCRKEILVKYPDAKEIFLKYTGETSYTKMEITTK